MNLIRVLLEYHNTTPLHWITFDTISGQMIDCSMHPTHPQRQTYQNKRYGIKGDWLTMRWGGNQYQERKYETITEIKIGEDQ